MIGNEVKNFSDDAQFNHSTIIRILLMELVSRLCIRYDSLGSLAETLLTIIGFHVLIPVSIAAAILICVNAGLGWETWIVLLALVFAVLMYAGFIDQKRANHTC